MNERIRELMVKSGAFDYYEINEGVNGDERPMIKFAELIVRECALIAGLMEHNNHKNIGAAILDRFEIENDI